MTAATGVGSMPGAAFDEALALVLGELPDLPHLPELPARGPHASLVGRGLAVVSGLDADLTPDGWRVTGTSGAPGVDHRRARSLLAQDLDVLEERTQGLSGPLKVQVAGPWTLAAHVERPRGDRVLGDRGLRRDLALALAEGVRDHVAELRRRVPGADVVLQLDEPGLPSVLAGRVATASGLHTHRSVDAPEAASLLAPVLDAASSAGATTVVHCCAAEVPVELLRQSGAHGVGVDLEVLSVSSYDLVAELLEAGSPVHLGVVSARAPDPSPTEAQVTNRVLRFLDMLGLEPAATPSLVVSPACGLAGAAQGWVRDALRLLRGVARNLS